MAWADDLASTLSDQSPNLSNRLFFKLDVRRPEQRRILVTLEMDRDACLAEQASSGGDVPPGFCDATLFQPTWTPGSYMIREYSRNLGPVMACDASTGRAISCTKVRKNRFRLLLPSTCERVRITYTVYAHELTVRTADLTPEHAYWNHACVLLWPLGRADHEARILVLVPHGWDFASTLPQVGRNGEAIELAARNLDHALDSPCLTGRFRRIDWQVCGIPHSVVLDGLGGLHPPEHFISHLTGIVEQSADIFGGDLPYSQYLFLCLFSDEGHGGLEHRDSTTLLSARTALLPGKGYQNLMGLMAHEFFHVWNVKRMRPEELWSYDFEVENYTPMLWLAEGFTAYYDDLLCLRSGVLTQDEYLAIIAKNLNASLSGSGRLKQSLAEASFDAWIRLYRPDENTRNSTQNYYTNGSLVALLFDLTIRRESKGALSLDDAMRELYRTTFEAGRGYRREDVVACLSSATGNNMEGLLADLVDNRVDPNFGALFEDFGITLIVKDRDKPYLGLQFGAGTLVTNVNDDGPAYAAGLAPGDEILALDSVRVTQDCWQEVFKSLAIVGQPLRCLFSSRGLIVERTLIPIENPVGTISLELQANPNVVQLELRNAWLRRGMPMSQLPHKRL